MINDHGNPENIESKGSTELREKVELLMDNATDRYNNLFSSIRLGGVPLALPNWRMCIELGADLSTEERERIANSESFAGAMREAMETVGVAAEESEHFQDLCLNPNIITEEKYNEMVAHISKVEQIYQILLAKGYTAKEIRQ